MDERTSRQLSALGRVGELLDGAGIAYWLFGGWAVDLYAGGVTRAHDDLDVAVWLDDLPRIAELLDTDGWRHAASEEDDGGTAYEREHVRLELTYLVRDADGQVFTPLRARRARWPADAFGDDVGALAGARARVVALEALRRGKSTPRDEPDEAAKDRADYGVLSRLRG